MRWAWAAGAVVLIVGAAGLIRGHLPQSSPSAAASTSAPATPIVISAAYVRESVAPSDTAAAYFTVHNTASTPDRLETVTSGAGASAVLHTYSHGRMVAAPNGVVIPAHGTLRLATGKGHVMIEKLYGPLKPGMSVDLELTFARAGMIDVTAPVISLTARPPS